jgi:hypothetical protein|tara:strand:+ start:281 stop:1186 length:906 start_codon:yes stop_codon:yes gene_type:complete
VLHCGLHKTGTSYFQLNCRKNRNILQENRVLYIGPRTLKFDLVELWQHIDTGSDRVPRELQKNTRKILNKLCEGNEEMIDTILISCEAIFGTLHFGLFHNPDISLPSKENGEDTKGLYRYAETRTRRLMQVLENSLKSASIQWQIIFITRNEDEFIRSCHNQYVKEGNHLPSSASLNSFLETRDFSFAEKITLMSSLSKINDRLSEKTISQRSIEIIQLEYELVSNNQQPQQYFWNLLNAMLPEQAKNLSTDPRLKISNKNPNPRLNERGLDLAIKCHTFFTEEEWKLFRRFLERNFSGTN